MKTLTIGLIGLGTVGKGVAKLICSRQSFIKSKYGIELKLKTVCDLRVDPKFLKSVGKVKVTKNFNDIIKDPEINVVVELIGGHHPALEIIKGALDHGKHVVTANKAVISTFGQELFRLAHKNSRSIYFETAVLAGVPIIKTLTEGIAGNQYNGLHGIVNGTCNYILSEMESNGMSFEQAVKLAQAKGYAEADPSLDINGKDSAHKLAVLVMLAMGKFVNVADIYTEGITQIAAEDLKYAAEMGLTIKLLVIAKKRPDGIEVRVHPTLISRKHSLASVKGVYNAVQLEADAVGDILLVGQGAGQMAAASGVFSDLINLGIHNAVQDRTWIGDDPKEHCTLKILSMDRIETEFYIRLMVIDRPGALSRITGILGQCGVSIASVTQKTPGKNVPVPLVMLTHTAKEVQVRKALEKIGKLKEVKAKPVAIRMEQL
jgi:homoserine dehydrogenase